MKTFYLIRHAKSGHGIEFKTDFERTLNEQGKKDALLVSSFLKKSDFRCQVFVSSSARRAMETEQLFYETLAQDDMERINTRDLYLPEAQNIWEVIRRQNEQNSKIAFFSHNPGVQEFLLAINPKVEVPTCFFGHFESNCNLWKEVDVHNTKLISSVVPKMLK